MQEIGNWRHICVDAQRMFAEGTPWHVPWMSAVAPAVVEVASVETGARGWRRGWSAWRYLRGRHRLLD